MVSETRRTCSTLGLHPMFFFPSDTYALFYPLIRSPGSSSATRFMATTVSSADPLPITVTFLSLANSPLLVPFLEQPGESFFGHPCLHLLVTSFQGPRLDFHQLATDHAGHTWGSFLTPTYLLDFFNIGCPQCYAVTLEKT
jgi:hypothetical protein